MPKYLVIVESPAKSKTIENYLGEDYVVTSSKGHIRDLTTRGLGGYGVDVENHFKPQYKIMKDKHEVVRELKALVKKADKVYLATDPDREGEAISWHLYETLGLEKKDYERIVFHEITKSAVTHAMKNGRDIDMDLVRSQESRRIVDRIIGFSLSKLLQKKIGSKSAGRVQSVALKLIVDREKEIQAFDKQEYWEMNLNFTKKARKLKAKLEKHNNEKVEIKSEAEAVKIENDLTGKYIVDNIIRKEKEKSPKPPFITSTLQQDASNKYNFNARKTMQIAQKLYEGVELGKERVGLITYMRTDSTRLSDEFVNAAQKYITKEYGEEYYCGRVVIKKGKNIQDAHEAIRPSKITHTPESVKKYLTPDEYKLYSMIYDRAVASLMSNAKVEDEKVSIINNGYTFEVTGETVLFDGYLKVFHKYESDDSKALPEIEIGEEIKKATIDKEQKFTNPPLRFSEARLIKKMEELGIGRPSTYAVTMDTLKQRGYVKVEKKAFIPTKQGILTADKLEEYFSKIINIQYTADMEESLDKISKGKIVWYDELEEFYKDYKPLLDYAQEHMERMYPIMTDEICPECGSQLLIINGRYGEFIACSNFPKCHYTAKKEAPEPLVYTNVKCPNCEKGMIVERISKRGRSKGQKFYACDQYPRCKSTYTSLDEIPPYTGKKDSDNKEEEKKDENK